VVNPESEAKIERRNVRKNSRGAAGTPRQNAGMIQKNLAKKLRRSASFLQCFGVAVHQFT